MSYFRYFSFIGAACLLLMLIPEEKPLVFDFCARAIAAITLFWGSVYFLIRVDEYFYGFVALIFCILVQPLFEIPYDPLMWLIISILTIAFLILSGCLCIKFERIIAFSKKKYISSLESTYLH